METFWYIIKVLPGKERQLTELMNEQISLGRVKNIKRFVCPTEKEIIIVRNKKTLRDKVIYVGYLYFESESKLNDDDLKNITFLPNVMSMMGDKVPTLMRETDVSRIIKDDLLEDRIEGRKVTFTIGERVVVSDGPFHNFDGSIHEIRGNEVDVEVKVFGRNTLVSLSLDQLKKI